MSQFPMKMMLFLPKPHLTIKIWPISAKMAPVFCQKDLGIFLLTKTAKNLIRGSPCTVEYPVKKSANFVHKKNSKPYFNFNIVYAKTAFDRKNLPQDAIPQTFSIVRCSIVEFPNSLCAYQPGVARGIRRQRVLQCMQPEMRPSNFTSLPYCTSACKQMENQIKHGEIE